MHIKLLAELLDETELRFEEVDVPLLRFENALQNFAADVILRRFEIADRLLVKGMRAVFDRRKREEKAEAEVTPEKKEDAKE